MGKHADDRDGDVHPHTAKQIKPEDYEEVGEPDEEPAEGDDDED